MHSQSKYQAKDSQLLTNKEQLESQEEEEFPSSSEEEDGKDREEREHYEYWIWQKYIERNEL